MYWFYKCQSFWIFNDYKRSPGLTFGGGAGVEGGVAAWAGGGMGAPTKFFNLLNMVEFCVSYSKQAIHFSSLDHRSLQVP